MSKQCAYVYLAGVRLPVHTIEITIGAVDDPSHRRVRFLLNGRQPSAEDQLLAAESGFVYEDYLDFRKRLRREGEGNTEMLVRIVGTDERTLDSVSPFPCTPRELFSSSPRRRAMRALLGAGTSTQASSALWQKHISEIVPGSQEQYDLFVALASGISYGRSKGVSRNNAAQTELLLNSPVSSGILVSFLAGESLYDENWREWDEHTRSLVLRGLSDLHETKPEVLRAAMASSPGLALALRSSKLQAALYASYDVSADSAEGLRAAAAESLTQLVAGSPAGAILLEKVALARGPETSPVDDPLVRAAVLAHMQHAEDTAPSNAPVISAKLATYTDPSQTEEGEGLNGNRVEDPRWGRSVDGSDAATDVEGRIVLRPPSVSVSPELAAVYGMLLADPDPVVVRTALLAGGRSHVLSVEDYVGILENDAHGSDVKAAALEGLVALRAYHADELGNARDLLACVMKDTADSDPAESDDDVDAVFYHPQEEETVESPIRDVVPGVAAEHAGRLVATDSEVTRMAVEVLKSIPGDSAVPSDADKRLWEAAVRALPDEEKLKLIDGGWTGPKSCEWLMQKAAVESYSHPDLFEGTHRAAVTAHKEAEARMWEELSEVLGRPFYVLQDEVQERGWDALEERLHRKQGSEDAYTDAEIREARGLLETLREHRREAPQRRYPPHHVATHGPDPEDLRVQPLTEVRGYEVEHDGSRYVDSSEEDMSHLAEFDGQIRREWPRDIDPDHAADGGVEPLLRAAAKKDLHPLVKRALDAKLRPVTQPEEHEALFGLPAAPVAPHVRGTFPQRDGFVPRLAAIDIDGTLCNENDHIPTENRVAVRRFSDDGGIVVLTTTRPAEFAAKKARELLGGDRDNAYLICDDGALIVDLKTMTPLRGPVPSGPGPTGSQRVGNSLVLPGDGVRGLAEDPAKKQEEANALLLRATRVAAEVSRPGSTVVGAKSDQPDESGRTRDHVCVVKHATDKGSTLADLAHLLDVPLSETVVFGDGDVDVPMFNKVAAAGGVAVAVGSGSVSVLRRPCVSVVAPPAAEGGVGIVLGSLLDSGTPGLVAETEVPSDARAGHPREFHSQYVLTSSGVEQLHGGLRAVGLSRLVEPEPGRSSYGGLPAVPGHVTFAHPFDYKRMKRPMPAIDPNGSVEVVGYIDTPEVTALVCRVAANGESGVKRDDGGMFHVTLKTHGGLAPISSNHALREYPYTPLPGGPLPIDTLAVPSTTEPV